jgi:tetratricopeptide (TPR) repeat protein
MTDVPQSDNLNSAQPTSVTSVSGGVNVDASTIGGDVVGRDKITQNTRIRQFIITGVGIGLVAIAVALVIASVVFNAGPLAALLPTPGPSPTPLAFPPASAGPSLIIVADFEDRSGGKYQGIDPAQYIYEQLTAQAKKDNLDVRLERLRRTVDDNTVRPTGETYSATLVLWGWYDALTITPRVERIKVRSDYQSAEEGKHLSLADPTKVEFSIVTDLPSQSTYLVFLVLGLDAYSDPVRSYDEVLPYFFSAIESIPTNVTVVTNPTEAYFFRGLVYYYKNDYGRAVDDYDRAIQLKPDSVQAYVNRGVAHRYNGDPDHAIVDFDRAIQLKPDDAYAHLNRGVAYYDKGDRDRAITDFDKAIQLRPDYAEAYYNRGFIYDDEGAYDQAIADYDQAIRLKSDDADAYVNRGIAYYKKGDDDRAIADYDKAIQLSPNYATAYYNRGYANMLKREKDKAIADFKKVLEFSNDLALRQCAQDALNFLGAQ